MYNFTKQKNIEVEGGVEDINYQSKVAILTDFKKWRLKDPKMELIEKKPKIN